MSLKTKKFILFMLFAGTFFIYNPVTAQVPEGIIESLKKGNARVLSDYFNQNVELDTPGSDNVYSKAQAHLIVSNFFSNNTPQNFQVIHRGGKEGAQYVIGILTTKTGAFRVSFLLKKEEDKDYIHQLQIEKQEKPDEPRVD